MSVRKYSSALSCTVSPSEAPSTAVFSEHGAACVHAAPMPVGDA
jgi:hypothetical protein